MLTLADEGQCDAATQAGHPACLTSLAPNIGTSSSEGSGGSGTGSTNPNSAGSNPGQTSSPTASNLTSSNPQTTQLLSCGSSIGATGTPQIAIEATNQIAGANSGC
jgi:hypothetical protein